MKTAWASEVALGIKEPAAKPDHQRSIPGTHVVEGETLTSTCKICRCTPTHLYTST